MKRRLPFSLSEFHGVFFYGLSTIFWHYLVAFKSTLTKQ